MKFCKTCGSQMEDSSAFCTVCGAAAEAVPAQQPAVSAAPAQQPVYQQPVYQQPVYQQPVRQLPTNRSMIKTILLSIITLGIYSLVVQTKMADELNIAASKYDGKRTMNYCLLVFVVSPLTLLIGSFVWYHKYCARLGAEITRRGIDFSIGAGTFWGWCVLGTLIIVGPFVFLYKIIKASNLINEDYNLKG